MVLNNKQIVNELKGIDQEQIDANQRYFNKGGFIKALIERLEEVEGQEQLIDIASGLCKYLMQSPKVVDQNIGSANMIMVNRIKQGRNPHERSNS